MKRSFVFTLTIAIMLFFTACGGPKQVENKSYSATINHVSMDGIFTGTYEKGKPNGQGTFSYSGNGISVLYSGQWVDGIPTGDGKLEFAGYSVMNGGNTYTGTYSGDSLNGLPHGTGSFKSDHHENSLIYSGEWNEGHIAGTGKIEISSMKITYNDLSLTGQYKGETSNGLPNGIGDFLMEDGKMALSYSGEWTDGNLSNAGTIDVNFHSITMPNCNPMTGTYSGQVFNGLPDGEGTFRAVNDNDGYYSYSGSWKEGNPSGKGQLDVEKMAVEYAGTTHIGKYVGEAENGLPSGNGEFAANDEDNYLSYSGIWLNGGIYGPGKIDTNVFNANFKDGDKSGKYTGDILNGRAEGEGTFTTRNMHDNLYTYTGEWKDGNWNGFGTWSFPEVDTIDRIGTFTDGEFTPTVADFFVSFGTRDDHEYTISENALNFLNSYPEVFLENKVDNDTIEYEKNFKYNNFSKNPSKYGSKLIKVSNLKVIQIFEYEDFGYEHTFLIAEDSKYNVYYIRVMGYWDNVYEGSKIKLTALPLDYFTYPNVSGTAIWAIACAGVRIDK